MHRGVLLALVLSVAAWATLAPIEPTVAPLIEASAADTCSVPTVANAPSGTSGPDTRWDVGSPPDASVTESLWKSSLVHADLAGARCREVFSQTLDRTRRHVASGRRSAHLLHVPLLI